MNAKPLVWFALGCTLSGCLRLPGEQAIGSANHFYRQGHYQQAEAVYQTAFTDTKVRGAAYYNAGNAAYQQGAFQRAVTYYERALDFAPQDEDAWNNLEMARQQLKSGEPNLASPQSETEKQKDLSRSLQAMQARPSQRPARDVFSLPPEELLKQMRRQMEGGYNYRPGDDQSPRPTPVPDEVDW